MARVFLQNKLYILVMARVFRQEFSYKLILPYETTEYSNEHTFWSWGLRLHYIVKENIGFS